MALFIRPNSRQIPSSIEYTGDKYYHDLMYAYLQTISLPGRDGVRYVTSADVKFTKLGAALGIHRNTAKKYFEELVEIQLLDKVGTKWELSFVGEGYAYLVPNDILEMLVETGMNHIVSVYVFFCVLSYGQDNIEYALNAVKSFIGIGTDTYSNSYIVTNALDKLQELGLLEHIEFRTQENGQWKSQKIVRKVKNER